MGAMLLGELGISVSLEVNSLGCPECRPGYRAQLIAYIGDRLDTLCGDCKRRSATNPLRVLDCKVPACREQMQDAPALQDHLCASCADHFEKVQAGLKQLNVQYSLNKFMVRGLDYYCRTTFEFITSDLGAQAAVAAGGRYDGLIETLGGPKNSPGIGFAMGMERLVLLLQQEKGFLPTDEIDLFVAGVGENGSYTAFALAHALRAEKLKIAIDHEGRSLKSQMKQAHKACARFVLIIGDAELAVGKGVLRNMATEQQQEVELVADEIGARIRRRDDGKQFIILRPK